MLGADSGPLQRKRCALKHRAIAPVPSSLPPSMKTDTYFMFMGVSLSLCTVCVPGARGCWGRASDPLGLELHMVGSHHVGLGPEPGPPSEQTALLTAELSFQHHT